MYKLNQNSITRLADGACIPFADGNRDYEEYKQWLLDGNTPEPEFTEAELLDKAKTAKKQELETAFKVASKLPVTVGTKTYNGGIESTQAIRDYIQLVSESGGTVFTIWDNSNVFADYTLDQANAIKLAIATKVFEGELNLRIKKNAVDDATTISAAEAVTF